MTSEQFRRESGLPVTAAAPTDHVRIMRGEKSMAVPIASLPVSSAVDERLTVVEQSQAAGMLGYATLADRPAPGVAGRLVRITNDPTPANNGTYRDTGSAWVKAADPTDELAAEIDLKADQAAFVTLNQQVTEFISEFGFESLEDAPATLPVFDAAGRVALEIPYTATGLAHFEAVDAEVVPFLVDARGNVVMEKPTTETPEVHALAPTTTGIGYRLDRLRKTNMLLGGLEAAETGYKLNVTCFGDSWIDSSTLWLRTAAKILRTRYGDAGVGYVDVGTSNPARDGVGYSTTGTWTVEDETAPGPAIFMREGSSGATLTLIGNTLPANLQSATLIFEGVASGTLNYAWNGGGASGSIDMAGSGMFTAELGTPNPSTPWQLVLTVASGTARLAGIVLRHNLDGVVINKCGNAGSNSADWVSVNSAKWIAGAAAVPTDLAVILLGTNDLRDGIGPEEYAANLTEMVRRIRAAHPAASNLPGPDVLLVIPPEVYRSSGNTPTTPYLEAVLAIADELDVAVMDLTESIGNPYDRRDWFDGSGVHPVTETSGRIIARQFVKALTTL